MNITKQLTRFHRPAVCARQGAWRGGFRNDGAQANDLYSLIGKLSIENGQGAGFDIGDECNPSQNCTFFKLNSRSWPSPEDSMQARKT